MYQLITDIPAVLVTGTEFAWNAQAFCTGPNDVMVQGGAIVSNLYQTTGGRLSSYPVLLNGKLGWTVSAITFAYNISIKVSSVLICQTP
jgi:hypothetical protein